jgi:hypothetical protein
MCWVHHIYDIGVVHVRGCHMGYPTWQRGVFYAFKMCTKKDHSGITRCTFLRGFQIWLPQLNTFPTWAGKRKILTQPWRCEIWPPLQFTCFNMFLDLFLRTFWICKQKIIEHACTTHHTQITDWGTGSRSGDILRLRPFNLHLDSFLKEILNLQRESSNSHYSTCYTQNHDFSIEPGQVMFSDWNHSNCI